MSTRIAAARAASALEQPSYEDLMRGYAAWLRNSAGVQLAKDPRGLVRLSPEFAVTLSKMFDYAAEELARLHHPPGHSA